MRHCVYVKTIWEFLFALVTFYLLLPLLLYPSFPLFPQLFSSVPLLCLLENPEKENTLNKKSLREKYIFFLKGHLTLLHLPPLDSTVWEDAGIEPRTVATLPLAFRRPSHLSRSPNRGPAILILQRLILKEKILSQELGEQKTCK